MISKILKEPREPWLLHTSQKDWRPSLSDNLVEIRMDSSKAGSLDGFYDEVSSAFCFPDYFGRNLNALDECLTDLEWLPGEGYVAVFENAATLLADEDFEVLESVLAIFSNAGYEWSLDVRQGDASDRHAKPFHTVFEFSEEKSATEYLLKWEQSGVPIDPLK